MRRIALLFLFTMLAAWTVWPAPTRPYTVLPNGLSSPDSVPMLNAWSIWWNADRLGHGLAGYWNAPIFYPESGTFAFSEPQPATCCVAPIVWLTGSPTAAYHVYLLATLVLNGTFAYRLLRTLRVGRPAATAGAAGVILLPLVHQHREAMQLMALWGVLWTLEMLIKHHRRPTCRRGILLAIAFASVFSTCVHHGLFLALLLMLSAWITIPLRRWKRWLVGAAVGVITAGLLLAPLLLPMHRILKEHEFARTTAKAQALSATTDQWLRTEPGAWTGGPHASGALAPGWVRAALALTGLVLAIRYSRDRRPVTFLGLFAACAFCASLGLNVKIGDWQPWLTLSHWIPGFSQVRSVYRFAFFVQLSVVLLAALGLDRLHREKFFRAAALRFPQFRWALFAVVAFTIAFEVTPARVRLANVPDVSREIPWTTFLRNQAPQARAIVCLPFADDYSASGSGPTGRWMLYAARHRLPMVNGYSGFFPPDWFGMVNLFKAEPYSDSTLSSLAKIGVDCLVIGPEFVVDHGPPPATTPSCRLVRVFADESGVEVWQLRIRPDPRGPAPGR